MLAITDFIINNWGAILLVFFVLDQIVKLTPTEKDNNILGIVKDIIVKIYEYITAPSRVKGEAPKKNLWNLIFNK